MPSNKDSSSYAKGAPGYAGYEYQIDVTVWLTLHLVANLRVADSVHIEPASQEDLEVEIELPEQTQTIKAQGKKYTLVVQAKQRTTSIWTEAKLKKVLLHGGSKRPSAIEQLERCDVRYMLVTDAGLNAKTAGLRVNDPINSWPRNIPSSLSELNTVDLAGRISVLPDLDNEKISYRIKDILTDLFRVPQGRWNLCREELRVAVRARMTGESDGIWAREELERVVKEHDGYFASSPELETFVKPTNWQQITSTLHDQRAVVIVGASGSGKTMASRKLIDDLRSDIPGLEHVTVNGGPGELHGDRTQPPVVYEIQDPWGRLTFDSNKRDWNQQLQAFLETRLEGDVYVVVTSRYDVAASTEDALGRIRPWVVPLEPEHYGEAERTQIYTSMAERLPRRFQRVASNAEWEVLEKLRTPLEIQKFFDALTFSKSGQSEPELIRDAIGKAYKSAIELNVAEQIEERRDACAAVVLWGMLRVSDSIPLGVVTKVEECLYNRNENIVHGVMSLVQFLIAGHNLRQGSEGSEVSYYHPRVEAGIERVLFDDIHRLNTKHILEILIELFASDDAPDERWNIAAAAELLASTRNIQGLRVAATILTQQVIDDWLSSHRPETEWEFQNHVELAATAGSIDSAIAQVGRFLIDWKEYAQSWNFTLEEQIPERDDAWFCWVTASPVTRETIERYVREVLPSDYTSNYPSDFVRSLERLAPDLSDAFIDAAHQVVGRGVYAPATTIARGAVQDLDGFEKVLDEAVLILESEEKKEEAQALNLKILNGEFNEDYATFLAESFDHGFTANEFLESYVEQVHASGNWIRIKNHRHRAHLIRHWLNILLRESDARVDADEALAAVTVGFGCESEETVWAVAAKTWDSRYLTLLKERNLAGHPCSESRNAALKCLVLHVPEALIPLVVQLRNEREFCRLVEIAIDISLWLRNKPNLYPTPTATQARQALKHLPRDIAGLSDASLALQKETKPVVLDESFLLLRSAEEGSADVRQLRLSIAEFEQLDVKRDILWLLENGEAPSVGVVALHAAVQQRIEEVVWSALDHRYADVVAAAVTALGATTASPLSNVLLDLCQSRASQVRMALVKTLKARPHSEYARTLLKLLHDEWSMYSDHYGSDAKFPIARLAMETLSLLVPLEHYAMEEIYKVVSMTADSVIREAGLRIFARSEEPVHRHQLVELALRRGYEELQQAAISALRDEEERVSEKMMTMVSSEELISQPPLVAAALACLIGSCASQKAVLEIGNVLVGDQRRRVLVVLLIRFVKKRSTEVARQLATLLGDRYSAVAWALNSPRGDSLDASFLDELGSIDVCEAVYVYLV